MVKSRTRRVQGAASTHQRAADLLLVLAGLALFFTALFVGYGLWERYAAGQAFTAQALFTTLAQLVGGLALGAFFLALSWVLRVLESLTRALDRFRSSLGMLASEETPHEARPMPPNFISPDAIRHVRELLEEIRDYSLMTPEQKQGRWDRLLAHRRSELGEAVQDLLRQRKFVDALHELDRFEELYGRDEETVAVRRKYDAARRIAERRDLAEALDAYATLKSAREWDQAREMAEDLLSTYPQSLEIREWIGQISRDRDQVSAEHRARLVKDVQAHTGEREWRKALGVARTLLDEYPDSAEATAVRGQMDTLEANAEIETRQELENEIKELIKNRKFVEALDLANQMITNYPESPQAEALRSQLPRLRQRAEETTGSRT
jgi:tetratricopeptide (TPR) repeat protein